MQLDRHFLRQCATAYLLAGLLSCISAGAAPMVFTLNTAEPLKPKDVRFTQSVLTLALQKTQARWGDFRIQYVPGMSAKRVQKELQNNGYENLVVQTTFQNQYLAQDLDYVRFPIDLGLTSYRLCFSSPHTHRLLSAGVTKDILQKLQIAQGLGWADVGVLQKNGFQVLEMGSVSSIFNMLAHERVQLFCRGVNEISPTVQAGAQAEGISLEPGFALHYELPRFFFLNKKNALARQRIEQGLRMAYADGSLWALQVHFFKAAVNAAHMPQRKVFALESTGIDGIDFDYKKYQPTTVWQGW